MKIGIRLHDTAGSNLEEHLRNAREQGFSCVHIAMSKVVPGFKMADAPELLTDALADEVRGMLEKYNQRCVLLGCYLNLCSPDLSAHERTLMNYRAHLRFGKKIGALMVGTETGAPNIGYKSCPECRKEESLRLFIERVKPVVRWAEEEGMMLAIEPVTRHIVCTAERCQRVLAEVHSENLRVILDAVNLLDRENVHQAQEVVTDAIARLGDSAELLHIKDFLPDGTDECAWARQNIANVNMFDGLLSIAPGLGQMDYRPLMQLAKRRNLPMTLEVDHHVAGNMSREIDLLAESWHVHRIVFDFAGTDFMDSSGIGILIGRKKTMDMHAGKVTAVNLGERVYKIFEKSGLFQIISLEEEEK